MPSVVNQNYNSLVNIPTSSRANGSWRNYTFGNITLPATWSNGSFQFKATVNGTLDGTPTGEYLSITMKKQGTGTQPSAGLNFNPQNQSSGITSGGSKVYYTNVVQTNTTIANGSFSAGDVVDIYMSIYSTYWDALSIAVEIEYGVAAGVTSGSIISLKDTGVLFGDTAPHSLSELYGEPFSGGTTAPASGTINLNAFNGETPPAVTITGFTIGTYSTTYLVPPVLSSTTQSNYTVSGHTGTNNLLKAFDRAAYSNYDSRTGGANSIDVIFNNNIYQGSATTWTGVATYDAPWIQVELPTARTVVGMVIRSEAVTNVGQKLRLLGSNDNTNWDLVFSTNTTINNPGGGRNNMNPIVIQFSSTTGSYKYYAYVWLGITATTGTYLARLAQFNLITQ